jgi:galactosamine-6-phosphate isomerase
MKIVRTDSYESLSRETASLIIKELQRKKNALLCAATGNSPEGTYKLLSERYTKERELFSLLRVIKLDEWGGIPMNNPGTCESFLQKHLIGPLEIESKRYISFKSDPKDADKECTRIEDELKKNGPIDICILGLGMNGHLALNEPGNFLESNIHVAKLSEVTLTHTMVHQMGSLPTYGLTLGMKDILQSSLILLLISGVKKKNITAEFLKKNITTELPASFLWLHPNVFCLADQEALPGE